MIDYLLISNLELSSLESRLTRESSSFDSE